MDQITKKLANKQNKESIISETKNNSFVNKMDIVSHESNHNNKRTNDNTPDKDELIVESVDDEE